MEMLSKKVCIACIKRGLGFDISTDSLEKDCYEEWWLKTPKWYCYICERWIFRKGKPPKECEYILEHLVDVK